MFCFFFSRWNDEVSVRLCGNQAHQHVTRTVHEFMSSTEVHSDLMDLPKSPAACLRMLSGWVQLVVEKVLQKWCTYGTDTHELVVGEMWIIIGMKLVVICLWFRIFQRATFNVVDITTSSECRSLVNYSIPYQLLLWRGNTQNYCHVVAPPPKQQKNVCSIADCVLRMHRHYRSANWG